MFWRRLGYLLCLAGCGVFFWAYRRWLSGFLLVLVLVLPIFSFLISLVPMILTRLRLDCPSTKQMGEVFEALPMIGGRLPAGPVKVRLKMKNLQTGQVSRSSRDMIVPAEHCGGWELIPCRAWVRDYLGLISLPIRKKEGCTVIIRPQPVPMERVPDIQPYLSCAFRPKAGGGYAEQHEMRLYRPGDQLRQVHWKLSAKAGKLVIREPMEPLRGKALVTLRLSGTPAQLDEKLGKLIWLSNWLLENQIPHRIQCITGSGMQTFEVTELQFALQAIDQLLLCPLACKEQTAVFDRGTWHCHIGGDGDAA